MTARAGCFCHPGEKLSVGVRAVMKGAEGGDAVSVFTGPEPAC